MNLEIEEEIKIEKLYAVVEKNNSYFVELGKWWGEMGVDIGKLVVEI